MADKDKSKAIWQRGVLKVGTAGSQAGNLFGYIGRESGLIVHVDKSVERYFVDDLDGAAIIKTTSRGMRVAGKAIQIEPDVVDHVLGIDDLANKFTIGGTSCTDKQFSVRVEAVRRDNAMVIATMPYAQSIAAVEMLLSTDKVTELDFEFEAPDDADTGMGTIEIGANEAVTIATGDAAVSAAQDYIFLSGEGAAADALTTITWASVVTGDKLMVQIADEDQVITVTHGAAAKNPTLVGAANWDMEDLDDWLLLEYNGTVYNEIARYDAEH